MQERYRLKKNYQFNYIFKHGKSAAAGSLVLVYAKNNNGRLKVGFSVGKKLGKATVRNRVKRRLKEGFRRLIPSVDRGYNYIFIPREQAVSDSYDDLCAAMRRAVKRAGLLKAETL